MKIDKFLVIKRRDAESNMHDSRAFAMQIAEDMIQVDGEEQQVLDNKLIAVVEPDVQAKITVIGKDSPP
jgi:hypothetical protein